MKKKVLLVGLICLLIISCDKKSSPTSPDTPTPQRPTINSFTANPTSIKFGETSTLSWSVSNATTVSIDQGIGTVSSSGSKSVSPAVTTTYTLTATNNDGTETKTCVITVTVAAQVIMHEGPLWRVSASGNLAYHYGIVKNIGNRKADYTKIYIYLYKSDGGLFRFEYTYADKTEIQPNETSPWEVLWWYPDIKDKFDPSKTTYEIEWSEYDWIYRTGQISMWGK